MEENASLSSGVGELIKRNLLIVILIVAGCILGGVGVIQYLASNSSTDVKFSKGSESKSSEVAGAATLAPQKVAIDVTGEVVRPGVYTLPVDARVQDALDAAGGLTGNADSEYISKKLNLAQKLIDGGKLYIPAVGEIASNAVVSAVAASTSIAQDSFAASTTNGLININSASEKDLDTLPKIGPVTAQKIIAGRPYMAIEELVSKKVLTQKTFEGLKDKIVTQ